MKKCEYCGRENVDTAEKCHECGSPMLKRRSQKLCAEAEPVRASDRHDLEPDEVPPDPFAQKHGNSVTLKCRTPGEAYLVKQELEQADILTILPEEAAMVLEYEKKGYVEIQVSGNAYTSVSDLQSVVEFQYKRLRADKPLPVFGKVIAIGCGTLFLPGLLVFMLLFSSYRANRYERMAKEFRVWFLFSLAAWILLVMGLIFFG